MQPRADRRIGDVTLTIVRPMLGVWRSEIDDYIRAHALQFREDETNRSLANTRSRMRYEIIPAIENALGRDVRKSIWKAAQIFQAQQEFIRDLLPAPSLELSVVELRAMPASRRSFVIFDWLVKNGISDVGYDLVQRVCSLIDDPRRSKVNLPRGRFARRRAKRLFLE